MTFSEEQQEAYAKQFRAERADTLYTPSPQGTMKFVAPEGYDSRLDHFANFFQSMQDGKARL